MKDLLKAIVFIGIFAVPFLTLYVENDFFFPFITGKNFAFRIIIEIIFSSWILLSLYDKSYRPRFSWILAGFSSLLIVMAFANALGEYPPKSFWSNFERMDGYVTLVHLFMYLVVVGSVITTQKLWAYLLHTSVVVALWVAIYGLMQHAGMASGNGVRIDSKLGNAAYMAVYMLFHIFIVFYLFVRSKLNLHRIVYALVALIFIYALLLTGTRGTFLGFVGGTVAAVSYVAIFGAKYPKLRKIAAAGFLGIILAGGVFFSAKDSDFVKNSLALNRIASIDLAKDLGTRGVIWGMALEGVKERPVLGWGQGNFNYVFNKQFEPVLWNKEAWFDRVHDIFLDWLIAGGVLGLLAYLSIFVASFYYLFWQPLRTPKEDHKFDVLERAVLIGLLVGYFAHNLVVFDNIISYIFFGTILALIHSRVSTEIPEVQNWKIDERLVTQIAVPIVVVITGLILWFANIPGMQATSDIINAIRQQTASGRLAEFDKALSRNSFATQEIVEQFAQNAITIAQSKNVPVEEKKAFVNRAEQELQKLVIEKPNDARLYTFFATFYRSIGAMELAQEKAAIARELSPRKQSIIIEQGVIELQMSHPEAARDFFKEAYELYDTNYNALVLYASALVETGDIDKAKELVGTKYMDRFAANDYALSVVDKSGDREWLAEMFKERIRQHPNNAQNRASLSFLYFEKGDLEESIKVLEDASETIPDFAPRASCFIDNIKAGNNPDVGCQ